MKANRTYNTIRNFSWYIYSVIVTTLFPFIIRSFLIRTLGIDYLGVGNLFTSILQIINLADIGFGSAIVVFLYKPVALNDTDRICAVLRVLRKCYRIIGVIIVLIGLFLLPFIPCMVKDKQYPDDINIYLIYIVYILNSAIPYLSNWYIETLFRANQRADVLYKIGGTSVSIMYVLQICSILIFKNYFIYSVIMLINPILYSMCLYYEKQTKYKDIICKGEVDKSFIISFKKKVIAIGLAKFRGVSRNSFDSVVLSYFLGLTLMVQYQNYFQIMLIPVFAISAIRYALTPSLGNSIATESVEYNFNIIMTYTFIQNAITTVCLSCMLILYQPFIRIWVGVENTLSFDIVVLMTVYFYIYSLIDIPSMLREVTGIWWEGSFFSIVEAFANIALNIILVKLIGMKGVILASIFTMLILNLPFEIYYIFKHFFKKNIVKFILNLLKLGCSTWGIVILTYIVLRNIDVNNIISLIVVAVLSVVLSMVLFFLVHIKNPELKNVVTLINNGLRK